MQASRAALLIDCDPGHDDALAIVLAAHLGRLIGITTVSGNAPLPAVTTNALAVLELLGLDVPVHSGATGPLRLPEGTDAPHALHVHGASGLGGSNLPNPGRAPDSTDAVGFLLEASRIHPDLWLVAIGPLTNVALAIERDPEFVRRLSGISIMGGSTAGGNVTASAEFNIWADPEAADVVFNAGGRIRLCGLNLTHQLKTSEAMLAALAASSASLARFAAGLIGFLHERMATLTGEARAALHDPCAVLAVTHPELFEFQSLPVAVELTGTLTRGMTVVDDRFRAAAGSEAAQPLVEVARRLDPAAAMELLLDALGVGTPLDEVP